MAVVTSVRTPSTKIYLEPGDATTCLAGAIVNEARFVKVTTAGLGNHPKVIQATGTTTSTGVGGAAYGVSHHYAARGAELSVLRAGTVGVLAGEAITSGDEVAVGSGGVAVKATANSQAGSGTYAVTYGLRAVGVATADIDNAAIGPITLYS
jgi:hypothetical protein